MKIIERGWGDDVTGRNGKLTHYYVDGESLCKKWKQWEYMTLKDPDKVGSKWCMECLICERKRKKLQQNES